MADENLRDKMIKAFEEGKHEEALKLSRKLDKQILKSYPDRHPRKKEPKKDMERGM